MKSIRQSWFTAIACLGLLTGGAVMAMTPPMTSDLEWMGRIVVEFSEELGTISVNSESDIALIGDKNLDALARQFAVYNMEKLIPYAQKPEDPAIRDISRYYIVEFPIDIDLHEVAAAYGLNPNIITAEPYHIRKSDYIPSDPFYVSQWAMSKVNANIAFDFCRGSEDIIVGIVDSGIDTAHADLRNNLWVNPGEDLNGNGIIEPFEWNGIDDDWNGYVDDFWGFNLWQNNNNVQDPVTAGHGTHCSGDASAVTDNAVGVSSLGFKAKIQTARAGDGQYIYAGIQGISYCGYNGSDVISCSWGGSYYNAYEQSVINNLWGNGKVIVASAGNENTTAPHYPSSYNNVVSVAATTQSDTKASFSNYGTTVDVCAPGVSILNTIPGGAYASWDGTSFSCPIVTGLVALVWAASPSMTNAQVVQQIFDTCVDIYPLNPGYMGMLGHGRIDAGAAISTLFPNLAYTEQTFDDAVGGNGNGRPEPGETVNLLLTIENSSSTVNATGVEVSLYCADPDINVTSSVSTIGNIPVLSSANNYGDPLTFTVDSNAEPHEVTFQLTLTESGHGLVIEEDLIQMVGFPEIVLVDDDGGAYYETWYQLDLETLGYVYETWNVNTQGEIPEGILQGYSVAIWHTSNVDNPLSTAEQNAITAYLNNGGKLFLTGEDIDEQLAGTGFYSSTLHCNSLGTAGFFTLDGVAGDPISSGTNLFLVGGGGAGNSQSPSTIEPTGTGANEVYTYTSNNLGGGIRWTNDTSYLVYFSFNFEAVSGGSSTPRSVVLTNIMDWFDIGSPPPPPPEFVVDVTYNSGSPVPAGGGNLYYGIYVRNDSGQPQNFTGWVDIVYEGGTPNTVLQRSFTNYQPGWTINRPNVYFPVPGSWAGGSYELYARVGIYPDTVWQEDSFPWTKLGAVDLNFDPGAFMPTSGFPNPFDEIIMTQPDELVPTEFAVLGAYPNPFNPATTISFELPQDARVILGIYDVQGRLVETLVDGFRTAGIHDATWDASGLSSGIYFYRIQAGGFSDTHKMVLLK